MIIRDGTGRVISLVIMTTFSPGRTTSESKGLSKGSDNARFTSFSSDSTEGHVLGRISPSTFSSGI